MRNPFKKRGAKIGIVVRGESEGLKCAGYTTLDHCPEIMTACRRIAELIGSMTIHLMANTEQGDIRITNELSRMIDITPMPNMTRSTWVQAFVRTMLLEGRGNAIVLPHTRGGYLKKLEPISADRVSFDYIGYSDYRVLIDGKPYKPNDVLHFVYNPDPVYLWKGQGIQISLRDVANNLKQAAATTKGFMESKWKPSVIVRVDAMTEELASPEGRDKLLDKYVKMEGEGKPWIVPGEQISVDTIKPLTLADLAIADTIELDKRTVASVLGIPPFLLGVGEYDQQAWNNFVQNTVREIALNISQEMTRKLILSPQWYLRFNVKSLMDWDLKTISDVYLSASDRGFIDGNEFRDRIGMNPRDELDELRILENYIPASMSGQQSKLIGGNENE